MLLVYRQIDKTDFSKLSRYFKTAAFIAALAALIPNPVKKIEPDLPNNLPSISRVIMVKTGENFKYERREIVSRIKDPDLDREAEKVLVVHFFFVTTQQLEKIYLI